MFHPLLITHPLRNIVAKPAGILNGQTLSWRRIAFPAGQAALHSDAG